MTSEAYPDRRKSAARRVENAAFEAAHLGLTQAEAEEAVRRAYAQAERTPPKEPR